jgi:hypothetical protein
MKRIEPVPKGQSVKYALAKKDITYFAVNQLGLIPYTWQSQFWDSINKDGQNVIACTSRQIGKTCAIAIFALWACLYNQMPLPSTGKTRIIVVSKSAEQSMKVIKDIRDWMRVGDDRVEKLTGGKVKTWFTDQIQKSQDATNTKSAITFSNRTEIISVPATESARGNTGSILFLDEGAFFENEEIFEQSLAPIVSQTGDRICMTSTPNGHQGFFFEHFDPDNKYKVHKFKRMWVPYTSLYLDDPELVVRIDAKGDHAHAVGKERMFEQEYMANFNASSSAFFDIEKIDAATKEDYTMPTKSELPCDVGVDFGKVVSRTVITISALRKTKDSSYVQVLYHYEYPPEQDESLVEDLKALHKRFNIQRIVFEDCPQSTLHTQNAVRDGLNIKMFNPAGEKSKKYMAFRAWLYQGRIHIPNIPELIKDMKGMIEEETPRTTKIYHGAGLRDDRVDSFMMSTYFFTEERTGLRVWDY